MVSDGNGWMSPGCCLAHDVGNFVETVHHAHFGVCMEFYTLAQFAGIDTVVTDFLIGLFDVLHHDGVHVFEGVELNFPADFHTGTGTQQAVDFSPLGLAGKTFAADGGSFVSDQHGNQVVSASDYTAFLLKEDAFHDNGSQRWVDVHESCIGFTHDVFTHDAVAFCRKFFFFLSPATAGLLSASAIAAEAASVKAAISAVTVGCRFLFCIFCLGFLVFLHGLFDILLFAGFHFFMNLLVKVFVVYEGNLSLDSEIVIQQHFETLGHVKIQLFSADFAQRLDGQILSVPGKMLGTDGLGDGRIISVDQFNHMRNEQAHDVISVQNHVLIVVVKLHPLDTVNLVNQACFHLLHV